MSIVSIDDPGFGCPLNLVLAVDAIGSTDAADQAKREARESGYRVKTLGWIKPELHDPTIDEHRDRTTWHVLLHVRPAAVA